MFETGLSSSVFSAGYTPGASNGTATWASPRAPRTATQAGFGTTANPDGGGPHKYTVGVLSAGAISLGLLIWIWWSLPR